MRKKDKKNPYSNMQASKTKFHSPIFLNVILKLAAKLSQLSKCIACHIRKE